MKNTLLFIFCLFTAISSAQFSKNHLIYFGLSNTFIGDFDGAEFSLNYINKSKYSFEFAFFAQYRRPLNIPDDHDEFLNIIFFMPNDYEAYDQIQSFKLLAGRVILTNSDRIRYNLKAGLAYSRISQVSNWVKRSGLYLFSPYDYDINFKRSFGIAFEPSLEFPLGRFIGASISPYALLNEKHSSYGCNFKIMIGLLRPKIR